MSGRRQDRAAGKHEGVIGADVSVSLLLSHVKSDVRALLCLRPRVVIELAVSNCGDDIRGVHVERGTPFGVEVEVLAARTGLSFDLALDFASRVASEYWKNEMFFTGELGIYWEDKVVTAADLGRYISVFEKNVRRGVKGKPRSIWPNRVYRELCDPSRNALAILRQAEAELALEGAKLAAEKPHIFTGDELCLLFPSTLDLQLLDPSDPLSKIEALHWLIDTLQSLNEQGRSSEYVSCKATEIWCKLVNLRIHRQPMRARSYVDGSIQKWTDTPS
jgi:hypothetical protein